MTKGTLTIWLETIAVCVAPTMSSKSSMSDIDSDRGGFLNISPNLCENILRHLH